MPTTVDEAALAILFKTSPQLGVVLHKQAVVEVIRNRIINTGRKESHEVQTKQVAAAKYTLAKTGGVGKLLAEWCNMKTSAFRDNAIQYASLADDCTPLPGAEYATMLAAAKAKLVELFPRVVEDHESEVTVLHLFMDSVRSVIYQAKDLTPGLAALLNAVDGPNMANASLTSRFQKIKLTNPDVNTSGQVKVVGQMELSSTASFSPHVHIKRDAARALMAEYGENEPAPQRQRIVLDGGVSDEANIGGVSQPSMNDVGPNCVGCVAKLAQATPKEMAQGGISCEQKHCMRWIADQREQSLCVNPASIMARPLTRKAGDGRQ